MPSLEFIPPLSAAGASKNSAPADDSSDVQPAEKFHTVMVRIAELFTSARTPVEKTPCALRQSPSATSSVTPSSYHNEATAGFSSGGEDDHPGHKILLLPFDDESSASRIQRKKNGEAGKTNAKKADGVHPALAGTVLTMVVNVLPDVAESASATVPVNTRRTNGDISTNPSSKLKTMLSGVIANDPESRTSADEQTPVTVRQSRISDKTIAGSEVPAKSSQTELPAASGIGRICPSEVEENNLPAGNQVECPETQELPATIIIKIGAALDAGSDFDGSQSDDGTAVARQDNTMKMALKKTKYSSVEQKLPGSAAVATGEKLPVPQLRILAREHAGDRSELVLPGSVAILAGDNAAKPFVPEIMDLPRITPNSPPYVQRTQEMISLQVMRLHETGADVMRVVIKPDAGLQLSLQLQQRDGGVEVQAVLERGNFGLLNRHWPDLQQQLESRGVRVAPLANADTSIGGGSEGFRQPTTPHGQHAGDDAEPAAMPVVLIPGLPPATAAASASRISSRHLETWA